MSQRQVALVKKFVTTQDDIERYMSFIEAKQKPSRSISKTLLADEISQAFLKHRLTEDEAIALIQMFGFKTKIVSVNDLFYHVFYDPTQAKERLVPLFEAKDVPGPPNEIEITPSPERETNQRNERETKERQERETNQKNDPDRNETKSKKSKRKKFIELKVSDNCPNVKYYVFRGNLNEMSAKNVKLLNDLFQELFPSSNNDFLNGVENAQNEAWIIATIDSVLVAMAYHDGKLMWNFGVARDFRRRGIGECLIRTVHSLLNGPLEFLVEAKNTGARNFYKALGAKQIMTYQPAAGQDDIMMRLS